MSTITIPVSPELAEIYERASDKDRERIIRWFQVILEDLSYRGKDRLFDIMDEMARQAQENGLTPEILDAILSDDDE